MIDGDFGGARQYRQDRAAGRGLRDPQPGRDQIGIGDGYGCQHGVKPGAFRVYFHQQRLRLPCTVGNIYQHRLPSLARNTEELCHGDFTKSGYGMNKAS